MGGRRTKPLMLWGRSGWCGLAPSTSDTRFSMLLKSKQWDVKKSLWGCCQHLTWNPPQKRVEHPTSKWHHAWVQVNAKSWEIANIETTWKICWNNVSLTASNKEYGWILLIFIFNDLKPRRYVSQKLEDSKPIIVLRKKRLVRSRLIRWPSQSSYLSVCFFSLASNCTARSEPGNTWAWSCLFGQEMLETKAINKQQIKRF